MEASDDIITKWRAVCKSHFADNNAESRKHVEYISHYQAGAAGPSPRFTEVTGITVDILSSASTVIRLQEIINEERAAFHRAFQANRRE